MSRASPVSERVRVRRHPERGLYDRASIDAVLDRALVAHVAFAHDRQPFCLPMLQARVGDRLYVHGSVASRTLRALGAGTPACVTVTLLEGLVLARSAFNHSANYSSVVLLGAFRRIDDAAEAIAAFEAFTDKLVPGRWREVRPPSRRELAATSILSMPIEEASVKTRSGPPGDDDSADADTETWAGVIPIVTSYGAPEPSPGLRGGIPLADSVRRLVGR